MAKAKAQSESPPEATSNVSEEELADMLEGLPEAQVTALVPVLRNLPAPIAERVSTMMEEMSSNQTGLEEMDTSWAPPIIKIRQPVSSDAPKNVQQGELYTAEGESFPEGFDFVPLYMHQAHLKFEEGDSTPSCRSEDGKKSIFGDSCKACPDEPFKHGEPTDCSKYRHVLVFDKDFRRIYKLALGKTSYKAGTKLMRYMKGSGKHPWKKIYSLETKEVERKGGGGVYYTFNVSPTGEEIQDPNMLDLGNFFYNEIKTVRTTVLNNLVKRQGMADSAAAGAVVEEDAASAAKNADEPDFGSGGSL